MSHSITTAASYVLNKYSRSYPSTSSLQGTLIESEWQHFTNPVMRITLEVRKSPLGQLLSMRLRILWDLYSESDDLHVDQREVVFEDLELLSFSSLPTFQASTALVQSDQGLPLKAVYRDAVVGIRYLHPKMVPPSSQPTYRRFQVTFKDALDTLQLIDAINIDRHPTMLSTSLARAATTVSGSVPARSAGLTERQSITLIPTPDPRPVLSSIQGHSPKSQTVPAVPPSLALSLSSDDSAFVTCSETSHRADIQTDRYAKDGLPKSCGRTSGSAQSSQPNSSQPSSIRSISMPPPPVPRRATHTKTLEPSGMVNTGGERSQFLAALSEHPNLYELSRAELETLVSQVIREEGFLGLLESLGSLWRAKGYLGH